MFLLGFQFIQSARIRTSVRKERLTKYVNSLLAGHRKESLLTGVRIKQVNFGENIN